MNCREKPIKGLCLLVNPKTAFDVIKMFKLSEHSQLQFEISPLFFNTYMGMREGKMGKLDD